MKDRVALSILSRAISLGRLDVTFPDGSTAVLQGSQPGPEASVTLYMPGVIAGALAGGALSLLESYMEREYDTDDLATFLLFAATNQQAWVKDRPRLYRWGRAASRRRDTRHTNVDTMASHYNLGNDFYAKWLDPSMTYSSARFDLASDLEDAQYAKYQALVSIADIRPGQRILEIGTGWGGFALHLARMGCHVTTLTIAEEQLAYVKSRMADETVSGTIDAHLLDFAHHEGTFDRVVSVEMIESIDETRWQELFHMIARSLAPGGVMAMQAIIIKDEFWDSYRANPDFIQRYIFPGGMLPSPALLRAMVAEAGLTWDREEAFGLDYARTLAIWHQRFDEAWPEIRKQDFDERFRRMWKGYLAYCEAGFRIGRINVVQFAAHR